MVQETKQYKISFFFSPLLNQQKLDDVVGNIKKWISDKGGSVSEKETPLTNIIKKRLAYPIKKYQEASYLHFNFELPTQLVKDFRQFLNLENDVLRYLIGIREKPAQKEDALGPPLPKTRSTSPAGRPAQEAIDLKMVDKIEPIPEEKKKEKVKIEELDKKLEEILNE